MNKKAYLGLGGLDDLDLEGAGVIAGARAIGLGDWLSSSEGREGEAGDCVLHLD